MNWKTKLVAALLCVLLIISAAFGCQKDVVKDTANVASPKTSALALPKYTIESVKYTLPESERVPYRQGLQPYLRTAIPAFLANAGEKNAACSPLNIYMVLAMLAEVTGGESRAQLEALLGGETEQLRDWASVLWQNNYRSGEGSQLLLGSSIWLNEGMEFKQNTLDLLADRYYAAAYQGEMGSEAFSQTYRDWMNAHTGGLLKEQISHMKLDADLAMNISATVYFTGAWSSAFNKALTVPQTFYAPNGEQEVQMMKKTRECNYYWGEHFTSVGLPMDVGNMWFLLPDEGVTPADLLAEEETMDFLLDRGHWADYKYLKVHLSVPRFDITTQTGLMADLRALGVTDVFTQGLADFSPITDETGLYASSVLHGVRVKVDEEKVEAAAYTSVPATGAAPPQELEEINFTLDRPFLFCVTGAQNLPLFTGIVNQP